MHILGIYQPFIYHGWGRQSGMGGQAIRNGRGRQSGMGGQAIRNGRAGNQEWAGTVSICIHNEETFDKKAQALILHQLVIFLITNMQYY